MNPGSGPRAVLLDVEGTTTPVTFVHDVLFPVARKGVAEFLRLHDGRPDVEEDVAALRGERTADVALGRPAPPWDESPVQSRRASAAAYARWLMDQDRKSTALKSLQGKIWEESYLSGGLRCPVYDDVPAAFERWKTEGRAIAIFSSGSVLAQKLLFAHTTLGDLSSWIGAYFDTTTGPKREAPSYRRIAEELGFAPGQILFVSDVAAELDAARIAGLRTALCVREGPRPPKSSHLIVGTFGELP